MILYNPKNCKNCFETQNTDKIKIFTKCLSLIFLYTRLALLQYVLVCMSFICVMNYLKQTSYQRCNLIN